MQYEQVFDEAQKSKVLKGVAVTRVVFDPRNKKHRESARQFLETGRWGDVQFIAELPFIEVPATVLNKLARYAVCKR